MNRKAILGGSLLLLLLVLHMTAEGITPPIKVYTVEELARKADRILYVRYIVGKPEKRGYRIVTLHRFEVLDTIKGKPTNRFEYYQAGGILDGIDERLEWMPTYKPGEEYVLFMKNPKKPKGLTAPLGSAQGKFRVWKDKDGAIYMDNPILTRMLENRLSREKEEDKMRVEKNQNDQKNYNTKRSLQALKEFLRQK